MNPSSSPASSHESFALLVEFAAISTRVEPVLAVADGLRDRGAEEGVAPPPGTSEGCAGGIMVSVVLAAGTDPIGGAPGASPPDRDGPLAPVVPVPGWLGPVAGAFPWWPPVERDACPGVDGCHAGGLLPGTGAMLPGVDGTRPGGETLVPLLCWPGADPGRRPGIWAGKDEALEADPLVLGALNLGAFLGAGRAGEGVTVTVGVPPADTRLCRRPAGGAFVLALPDGHAYVVRWPPRRPLSEPCCCLRPEPCCPGLFRSVEPAAATSPGAQRSELGR